MENNHREIRTAIRMLRELAGMAEEASLTGALQGGQKRAILRFNQVMEKLRILGALPDIGYSQLPDDASYAELAVEARFAASMLEPEESEPRRSSDFGTIVRLAPFVDSADLGALIREQLRSGAEVHPDLLAQLAPFLDRETLSDLLKSRFHSRPPEAPPSPEAPPRPPENPGRSIVWADGAPEVAEAATPEETSQRVTDLARRLGDSSISPYERAEILHELVRISSQG